MDKLEIAINENSARVVVSVPTGTDGEFLKVTLTPGRPGM
jgi:hypothetical protein